MSAYDIPRDAARAFDVMVNGGTALLPNDVGYSLIAATGPALKKIFDTKKRAPSKLNAMLGNDALHRALHVVGERGRKVYDVITEDYDLPLGCIAPCRSDHSFLRRLDPDTYARSTKHDTLLMLVNAGAFLEELTRLSFERGVLFFGSSANLSLTGAKFRVEDIEPEILAIADLVIDYGLRKYHPYRSSSTLLNLETLEVVRYGSCFEDIADAIKRHVAVDLPPRPDRAAE